MAKSSNGTDRWALIIKDTGEISNINTGSAPSLRPEHEGMYDVVEVDKDVQIGMVRSGSGFGWPAGHDKAPSNAGTTRLSDAEGPDSRAERIAHPTPQPDSMTPKPGPAVTDAAGKAKEPAKSATKGKAKAA